MASMNCSVHVPRTVDRPFIRVVMMFRTSSSRSSKESSSMILTRIILYFENFAPSGSLRKTWNTLSGSSRSLSSTSISMTFSVSSGRNSRHPVLAM